MNRRTLLAAMAISPLAACSSTTPPDPNLSQAVQDVNALSAGLSGMLAGLSASGAAGLTPDVLATVNGAIANLKTAAAAIAKTATAVAAQPVVQQVEGYVNTVVSVLGALPLPPPISTVLEAASVLLPIIEAAVGLLTPAAKMKAAPASMTPDQARLILLGNTGK